MENLKYKKFNLLYILFFGETFSNIGNGLFSIAINWYLYNLTTNSAIIGLISGIFNCSVLLNIFTGYFSDKHSRLNIMLATDILQVAISIIILLVYIHTDALIFVIILEFLSQVLGTFFLPAEDAILPLLSKYSNLTLNKANSINQSLQMITKILGIGIGGTLVSIIGLKYIIILNIFTFLISLICIIFIKNNYLESIYTLKQKNKKWYSGLHYILKNSMLRNIVLIAILINFSYSPIMNLSVIWIHKLLNASVFIYSFSQIFIFIGIILGSLLINFIKNNNFLNSIIMPIMFVGILVILIPIFSSNLLTLFFLLFIGIMVGFLNVYVYTFVQKNTPNNLLGSVNGTLISFSNISIPIGTFIGGLMIQHFGVTIIFLYNGVLLIILSLIYLFKFKKIS